MTPRAALSWLFAFCILVPVARASAESRDGREHGEAVCGDLGVNFGSHKCKVRLNTGITMAYLEVGPESGSTVILIHGLTDSIRSWILSMRALHAINPSLHIFAIDQRGHGATSMPPGPQCPGAPERCFAMKDFAAPCTCEMPGSPIPSRTQRFWRRTFPRRHKSGWAPGSVLPELSSRRTTPPDS